MFLNLANSNWYGARDDLPEMTYYLPPLWRECATASPTCLLLVQTSQVDCTCSAWKSIRFRLQITITQEIIGAVVADDDWLIPLVEGHEYFDWMEDFRWKMHLTLWWLSFSSLLTLVDADMKTWCDVTRELQMCPHYFDREVFIQPKCIIKEDRQCHLIVNKKHNHFVISQNKQ